uniref:Putative DNA-binding domain-containing protein n=1 Tax=Chondromyces catenulatus TaxID=1653841 RepID=A0A3S5GY13_9BACT|nr:hypothetical protein [Chondromyces catenulatus]
MPHDLASLQSFIAGALQRPSPIHADPALAARAGELVAGNARLSPAEQLDIYRRQFWLRHIEALRDDFPGVSYVLGEAPMRAFCEAYLAAHPPSTPSLRDLSDAVPGFAARESAQVAGDARRGLVVDMARYELALLDLFYGASAPPLDPGKLASLPEDAWERAQIKLNPLLKRLALDFPVHRLRKAIVANEAPPLPDAPAPARVALYRRELVTHFEELSVEAFALLDALDAGEALVPACERLMASQSPEAQEVLGRDVGVWFQQWTAWGWIVDVIL